MFQLPKMGKGNKRYYDAKSSPEKGKKRKDAEESIEAPNSGNDDFYYDAVDQFHNEKEKLYLNRMRARSPNAVQEEIYPIRSDEDDESDDDEQVGEEDESDDMRSDISDREDEEGYLPSANAWGNRRKAFYSTDFAGDDRAGLSGSDIEAAELEEQEAISLQKRLVQQMTVDDFKLDTGAESTSTAKLQEPGVNEKEVIQADLSSLTEEQKLELLNQQSPELLPLIEEYQAKSEISKNQLAPVANALLKLDDKTKANSMFDWVLKKYDLYMNYLLNLEFYFVLKAMRQPIDNHPVIDRIMSLKKLVDEVDKRYGHLDDNVDRLAKIVQKGSSIEDVIHLISAAAKTKKSKSVRKEKGKEKKQVRWNLEVEENGNRDEDAVGGEEVMEDGIGEKRGVTYEIEKNKGLTPSRKKEQKNPRVKNRMRFKKALHKKRSQLPDARKELQRYGGEIRGIKTNVVRSVKLH